MGAGNRPESSATVVNTVNCFAVSLCVTENNRKPLIVTTERDAKIKFLCSEIKFYFNTADFPVTFPASTIQW